MTNLNLSSANIIKMYNGSNEIDHLHGYIELKSILPFVLTILNKLKPTQN